MAFVNMLQEFDIVTIYIINVFIPFSYYFLLYSFATVHQLLLRNKELVYPESGTALES